MNQQTAHLVELTSALDAAEQAVQEAKARLGSAINDAINEHGFTVYTVIENTHLSRSRINGLRKLGR